ncbi:MAG: hypothetical protein H7144_05755 [Burkholderiales bacterium]|nr:hypothetical protein [Phycisphaerae bacterium]
MSDNFALLHEAIERNTPITVSLPSAGLMQPFRSRLLAVSDEGILLESSVAQVQDIDSLIKSGQPVRVVFRTDIRRVEFDAAIIERVPDYKLNAEVRVQAMRLHPPKEVRAVQRRADYRASVPQDESVKFQCWRVSEQDDFAGAPSETARMVLDVRDCSSGGIGGTWKRRKDDPPSLVLSQRLRIEVDSPVGKQTLEARLRFLEAVQDGTFMRVGIQFELSSTRIADRQKLLFLNKLMGELQRMELRRKKLAR